MGEVLLEISMSLDGFITGPKLRTRSRSGRLLRRNDEQA
jgi:hypothetical protein